MRSIYIQLWLGPAAAPLIVRMHIRLGVWLSCAIIRILHQALLVGFCTKNHLHGISTGSVAQWIKHVTKVLEAGGSSLTEINCFEQIS